MTDHGKVHSKMFDNTKTKFLAPVTESDFPQLQLISINYILVNRSNRASYFLVTYFIPVHRDKLSFASKITRTRENILFF